MLDAAIAQSLKERESFWRLRDAVSEFPLMWSPYCGYDVSLPIGDLGRFTHDGEHGALTREETPVKRGVPPRAGAQGLALSLASLDEMGRVGRIEQLLGREFQWQALDSLSPAAGGIELRLALTF